MLRLITTILRNEECHCVDDSYQQEDSEYFYPDSECDTKDKYQLSQGINI